MNNKEQDNKAMQPLSEQELNEVNGGGFRRPVFSCPKCQKTFYNKVEYDAHMKQHQQG